MPGGSHSKTVLAKGRGLKKLPTEPVDRWRVGHTRGIAGHANTLSFPRRRSCAPRSLTASGVSARIAFRSALR